GDPEVDVVKVRWARPRPQELRVSAPRPSRLIPGLREELGAGDSGARPELLHSPGRRARVVVVAESLVDEGLQLLVAEALPPRPVRQGGGAGCGGLAGRRASKLLRSRDRWPLVVRPHRAADEEERCRQKPSDLHDALLTPGPPCGAASMKTSICWPTKSGRSCRSIR